MGWYQHPLSLSLSLYVYTLDVITLVRLKGSGRNFKTDSPRASSVRQVYTRYCVFSYVSFPTSSPPKLNQIAHVSHRKRVFSSNADDRNNTLVSLFTTNLPFFTPFLSLSLSVPFYTRFARVCISSQVIQFPSVVKIERFFLAGGISSRKRRGEERERGKMRFPWLCNRGK